MVRSPLMSAAPVAALAATLTLCPVSASAAGSASSITVGDLVRFAQIGDPLALDYKGDAQEGGPGVFSPDGAHVAVLVGGGDPEGETNNATLWVYSTAELMRDPKPLKLAEFASSTPYQPIAFVRWLADNETLVFAGTRGEDRTQIYKANIRTRELRQLTQAAGQMMWYGVSPDASRLVTLSESIPVKPADDAECRRQGCRVSARSFIEAERGGAPGSSPAPPTMWRADAAGTHQSREPRRSG